jgi:hypothetical protein
MTINKKILKVERQSLSTSLRKKISKEFLFSQVKLVYFSLKISWKKNIKGMFGYTNPRGDWRGLNPLIVIFDLEGI